MPYKLIAQIDDMSMNEAKSVIRAILDMFGSQIVEEIIKQREYEIENQPINRD